MKNFLKNPICLLAMVLFFLNLPVFAQRATSAVSGSINCVIDQNPWSGHVQSAVYSPKGDYLTIGFEDDKARLEITLRSVKKEILKTIPYEDMVRGEFKAGYDKDLIFFVRFFPDKKKSDHYETSYMLLKGDFAVDELNLTAKTVKLGFDIECGRATRSYNPLKPDERDLEKLKIKNAETSVIKFVTL